jgi:ethanolamine ammonia-lyase large subunit
MLLRHSIDGVTYSFDDLKDLLAKASAARSGDELAGIAARTSVERVAAQMTLANLPLAAFLEEPLIPYEIDEVTRLIFDTHDTSAFASVAHLTVGGFRDMLLSDETTTETLKSLAPGLTPEMVAAVSKLMRVQDLIAVARKIRVVTRFRTTVGLPGRLSTRLQPNHPTDDPIGIAAAIVDGLLLGSGDAVIGINPAADDVASTGKLLRLIDSIRQRYSIPTQSCVLAHVTTQLAALEQGAPVDLVFQSIAGTELANTAFGINVALLAEANQAASELHRGVIGRTSCTSKPARGALFLRTLITASISRPVRLARMPSRAASIPCSSTPSSALSVLNIFTTASRSSAPGLKIISAASFSACRWAVMSAIPTMQRPIRTIWTRC